MFIGIDLGTSSVKMILVDHEQNILATSDSPLTVQNPKDGYSEQNPEEWINATLECLESLKIKKPKEFTETISIGISGHMHGATLIDKSGDVIRPCIYGMIQGHIKNVKNLKIKVLMFDQFQEILLCLVLLRQKLIG